MPNTIKLQEAATNILGLEFKELIPKLKYDAGINNYGNYVTIATKSTSGCKFWTKEGWQGVINYLVINKGYKVINVSLEENPFDNCEQIINHDIQKTMAIIHHSQFTIALGSGIAWLANALGKEVVMINNFAEEDHEFECIRITNKNVCNGCWNNQNFKFDKSWDWCPIYKNTPRQFECQRSITADDVINKLVLLKNI